MNTPRQDGFRMPAEWEPHERCWMIWPERPDNWRDDAKPAQQAFARMAAAISRYEPLTMLASAAQRQAARNALPACVDIIEMPSNDSWARDTGPSFVTNGRELRGVDWRFNAWAGLYAPWDADDRLASSLCDRLGIPCYRAPLVLEGGAIHVDGEGTALVTEACLLDPARNPGVTRPMMESWLADYLGVTTIIWLGQGIPEDETGGHVDNLACFASPGRVLLAWCGDPADPHHDVSRDAEARLRRHGMEIIKLPMPPPMFITAAEAAGIQPGDSNMQRGEGARLAASYVNFYLANGAVIAPAFGAATDGEAAAILARAFPGREIVMLPAREILLGGGNIHCITQQQPATAPAGRCRQQAAGFNNAAQG
ncbi:MAG TPA: agmatine deiminase [Acetobacteraceae bacterium]|nr:agmatine deiminase [Acetobacteraceae bacterium]